MMGPKDETNPLKRTKPHREGPDSKPLCFRTVCVFAADSSKVEQRRESWQGARGQGFAGRVNVGHSTTASGQQQTGDGGTAMPDWNHSLRSWAGSDVSYAPQNKPATLQENDLI